MHKTSSLHPIKKSQQTLSIHSVRNLSFRLRPSRPLPSCKVFSSARSWPIAYPGTGLIVMGLVGLYFQVSKGEGLGAEAGGLFVALVL